MTNIVDRLIAYESGDISVEGFFLLFSDLIRTEQIWDLQGHYQRQADYLINTGYLSLQGEILPKAEDLIDESRNETTSN